MKHRDDPLAPYDAVVMCSYGGPDGPNAVLPFMRNATRGRGIPDERLLAVAEHYSRYRGVSPIIARNAELLDAVNTELLARGSRIPAYLGNRNWHPYFADTLRRMIHAGHRRILMVPTAAYASYSGCRQYREDVWNALHQLVDEGVVGAEDVVVERAPLYYLAPGLIEANAEALREAWNDLVSDCDSGDDQEAPLAKGEVSTGERGDRPVVLFVTHSIPHGMNEASGNDGHDYVSQHHEHIDAILDSLPSDIHSAAHPLEYQLVYCSRSGPPQAKWLEPDVNDAIEELAARGVKSVIVAPIGFIQDHMEVVHDLDTEAAETAAAHGMTFRRSATAGIHPAFVSSLIDIMSERARAARDGLDTNLTGHPWHDDPDTCCIARPGAGVAHAISQRHTKEATMAHSTTHGTHPGHPTPARHPGPSGNQGGHSGGHPHPTGHEDGPADPRDHVVDPDEVNAKDHYFLHAAFRADEHHPQWQNLRANAADIAREITEAIAATGTEVRGFYNVEGFKADADFMVWFYADAPDKIQAAYRALRRSPLGMILTPSWNAMSAHIPAEFDARHLPACIGGAAPRDWIAVYPFVRSLDWYYLNPARRQAMLREHGMNGRGYLDVKVSTLAAFALGDYEWTLSLEADSLDRIMGVLRQQRGVEARVYTRIDTPFYTGRRMSLEEWLTR